MAKTFQHKFNDAIADQKWVNDVNILVRDKMNWDGTKLVPECDNIVVNNAAGHGLKVDETNPVYPWFDLLGEVHSDTNTGAAKPAFNAFIGNIKEWQMDIGNEVFVRFHMPHDYVPGTDLYIHAHWAHNSTIVTSGGADFRFECSYAKGYDQMAFTNPVTVGGNQNASTVQYQHMITEFQLSSVGGNGGTLINSNLLEVDGLILCRCYLNNLTINGSVKPFLFYIDLHYQSTGIGTKNKNIGFYS